jgi:hypothetical protein
MFSHLPYNCALFLEQIKNTRNTGMPGVHSSQCLSLLEFLLIKDGTVIMITGMKCNNQE